MNFIILKQILARNDIAKNNSDKVKALDNYYQKWWLEVSQKERLSPTIINPNYQKETVLTSQAWSGDIATYDQSHIRAGVKRGAWYIDVEVAGNYQIEFSRWPKESHLAINDFYQKDFSNQFFDSEFALYKKPSRAINAQSLTTLLDDTVVNKHRITTKQKTVKMDMYLSQGLHKIEGVMQTEKGQYSAYYLYIKQK